MNEKETTNERGGIVCFMEHICIQRNQVQSSYNSSSNNSSMKKKKHTRRQSTAASLNVRLFGLFGLLQFCFIPKAFPPTLSYTRLSPKKKIVAKANEEERENFKITKIKPDHSSIVFFFHRSSYVSFFALHDHFDFYFFYFIRRYVLFAFRSRPCAFVWFILYSDFCCLSHLLLLFFFLLY